MKKDNLKIVLVAIIGIVAIGVFKNLIAFNTLKLGLLVAALLGGAALILPSAGRTAFKLCGLLALATIGWVAWPFLLAITGLWPVLASLLVTGAVIALVTWLFSSILVLGWIRTAAAILVVVALFSFGPLSDWSQNWDQLKNFFSGSSSTAEEVAVNSDEAFTVPVGLINLHRNEFDKFVQRNGNRLSQSSLRAPAQDDWTDSVLKGEGKALKGFADVEVEIATNPTYLDMIIRGLSTEKTPSGKTYGELNPWMNWFIRWSELEGFGRWVRQDGSGNVIVTKGYQKYAFLTWTLLNRFADRGVQDGLEAEVHYPLEPMEINGLPRTYRQENSPYTGEFVVLAYTQKGQSCPFALYGLNTQDGRFAILKVKCDEKPDNPGTPDNTDPGTPDNTDPGTPTEYLENKSDKKSDYGVSEEYKEMEAVTDEQITQPPIVEPAATKEKEGAGTQMGTEVKPGDKAPVEVKIPPDNKEEEVAPPPEEYEETDPVELEDGEGNADNSKKNTSTAPAGGAAD